MSRGREALDAARKVLDQVDTTVDTLTLDGAILPGPYHLAVKIADAVRGLVDVVDDMIDQSENTPIAPPPRPLASVPSQESIEAEIDRRVKAAIAAAASSAPTTAPASSAPPFDPTESVPR